MKNNKKGFSLPLAMGIVILITILSLAILEFIIPFSKDVKGIENSSKSYYQANSGLEEGLYNVIIRNNTGTIDDREEYSKDYSGNISNNYNTVSSGTILPPIGEGNSEYDKDWNTISQGNPIQLSIGNGNITNDFEIVFRVPNIEGNLADLTLSGGSLPIVNWLLSSNDKTLNSSGGIITSDDVLESDEAYIDNSLNLWSNDGVLLDGTEQSIEDFYSTNCNNSTEKCILKLSVINKLETDESSPTLIPYLEWRLIIDSSKNIPLQYTKIKGGGKSNGYKKELEIKIPGKTVSQAFDFTVLQ